MSEIAGKEDEETEEDKVQGALIIARLDFAHKVVADHIVTINDIECKELEESLYKAESDYQDAYNAMCRFYEDEQLKDTQAEGTA